MSCFTRSAASRRRRVLVQATTEMFRASVESLEVRQLMSADFRSVDGTGNNLSNPTWGSTGVDLLRTAPAAYADGILAPAGATRPSARAISDAIAAALPDGTPNARNMSAFVYVWGQFIDHDMDLTTTGSPTEQSFNVQVPVGDPSFDPLGTGTQVIPLTRSTYDPATGTSTANPRQQTNTLTAWIDGSVVYGSDATRAAALRTFVGGKLKTSAGNLLPFNTAGLPNANDTHVLPDNQLFLGGDVRANENIELTSLQTLFVREHNRIATQIAKTFRGLSDEQIYQRTRQSVVAEIEAITYNEFLPALLGPGAISRYKGYDPTVNPGIANEFSTAAFRLGHSMLGDDVEFLDNNGVAVRDPLPLAQAFFNPGIVEANGIDPLLKYLASDRAQEIDSQVVDGVRNFLFGPPGSGGLDLASLNIQRGRDHGLADYNTTRVAYGLPAVTSFSQITSDPVLAAKLQTLYGTVNNVDLWVGGLAETHVAGGSVGPTFRAILSDQFERIRDGDRFWYQAQLGGADLSSLQGIQLSSIIKRNTGLTNIQNNVFFFDVSLSGRVFNDQNANRQLDFREPGLSGWTVELLDADGNVVASVLTSANGRYAFSGLDLGQFRVQVTAPTGWVATRQPGLISVKQSDNVDGLDVGITKLGTTIPVNPGHHDRGHR